ncbi:cytochrome c1 [Guyparkeria hydrothermalis]|uniref:cytochrome c1 n=1 Tax=Guyparkeria hydrothermalis TaxID=923 RepID=UPI0020223FA3|nr:cytochrome c1 [Guyparkeria hydrothermalis]MCL7743941.1 cytochrome c1 [Guyparkeria hydrothermalis]
MIRLTFFLFLIGVLVAPNAKAAGSSYPLKDAEVDLGDEASLFRGAQTFMDSCATCHSADMMRFGRIADDLGLSDEQLAKLMPTDKSKAGDTIETSMPSDYANQTFGIVPPDLTLVARVRGGDWLYTYLTTFYADPDAPWGVNNAVFPGVGMPHVLAAQQGLLQPVYETHGEGEDAKKELVDLEPPARPGTMSEEEFDQKMRDLTAFMVYMAEPAALLRAHYGPYVLAFLFIFTLVMYLLKKEYWRDIKH